MPVKRRDDGTVADEKTLRKSGNTFVVSLNRNLLIEAALKEGDTVELVADRDTRSITIQPADD